MATSKDKKIRDLKRKHDQLLEELAKSGMTLDENSKIVRLEPDQGSGGNGNGAQQGSGNQQEDGDQQANDESSNGNNDDQATASKPKSSTNKPKSSTNKPKCSRKNSKMIAAMFNQLAIVKHKSRAKVDEHDETLSFIKECVKKHLWPLVKIITSKTTEYKAAIMCLRYLDLEEFEGDDEESEALREQWITAYAHIVTSEINTHRSYVQNRVKKACDKWMATHDGVMPSKDILEKCVKREIDPDNVYELETMMWWWDDCLVYAAGNLDDWHADKRHYMPISRAAPPDTPQKFYIMPSTEGIAMAFIENNRSKWKALYDAKQQFPHTTKFIVTSKVRVDENGNETQEFTHNHKGKKGHTLCNGAKYMTKWTDSAAGQQEFNGWSKEGRDYYVKMFRANQEARKKATTSALEDAVLAMIKEDHGKTANSAEEEREASKKRKSKKAKAAPVEDDDDGMEW
jgi:hypothetical protein